MYMAGYKNPEGTIYLLGKDGQFTDKPDDALIVGNRDLALYLGKYRFAGTEMKPVIIELVNYLIRQVSEIE